MQVVRKYGRAMLLVVAAGLIAQQAAAAGEPAGSPTAHHATARLSLERENPSENTRLMAQWIVESGDSKGMPFVIVDKVDARVFVFQPDGSLSGATPALLGLAKGDDSIPGIGTRKMSSILPEERTTPAGRYVASLGRNLQGKGILWVDYEAAFSLHPVVTSNAKESRAQRLATPTVLDNRISYGCINVPAKFYSGVVNPAFMQSSGVVYVLPETRPLQAVFAGFGVTPRAHPKAASTGLN
ncbi:MAG: hypothetical protein V4693_08345 [Pseudomonadota bacterium]